MLHFRGGRAGITREAYPDSTAFYDDIARAYGDEIDDAGRRGLPLRPAGRHQPRLSVRPEHARGGASRRRRPRRAAATLAWLINDGRRGQAARHVLAMHLCRGNFKALARASGGYEPVAEAMFDEMDIDAYLPGIRRRAQGRFPAVAFPAQGQDRGARPGHHQVGEMESKDELKRRIEEAARYAPLDQLASARNAASRAASAARP